MAERAGEIYQALLEAGIEKKELLQKIKEKEVEFRGCMTKQGILYLIAKDYGIQVESSEDKDMLDYIAEEVIDYNDFAIPISNIREGMRNIVITGKVSEIADEHEFEKKDGTLGRVASFWVSDESDSMKVVLWDDQVNYFKNEYFKEGQIIQVIGGFCKKGFMDPLEVHLSRKGKIILAPQGTKLPKAEEQKTPIIEKKENPEQTSMVTIQDLYQKKGFIRSISGTIRIEKFKEITKKNGDKGFLLKIVLSDKKSSIVVNIWNDQATEILPSITDGMKVRIANVMIKENAFLNTKELSFTRSSRLDPVK